MATEKRATLAIWPMKDGVVTNLHPYKFDQVEELAQNCDTRDVVELLRLAYSVDLLLGTDMFQAATLVDAVAASQGVEAYATKQQNVVRAAYEKRNHVDALESATRWLHVYNNAVFKNVDVATLRALADNARADATLWGLVQAGVSVAHGGLAGKR